MLFEPKQNIARFSNMNLRSSVSSSMPSRKYTPARINSCRSAHFATHVSMRNAIGPRLVGSPAKPSAFQGPIHQKLPERLALHLHRILFYPILCKSRTVSIWHERTESTSFAGWFVQLDPPLFLPLGRIRKHICAINLSSSQVCHLNRLKNSLSKFGNELPLSHQQV